MIRRTLICTALLTLLTACGSDKHSVVLKQPDVIATPDLPAGRIAISYADSPEIELYELSNKALINSQTLSNPASALYPSPSGRYVVAIQRNHDLVEFIDSGIYLEKHNDHYDLIEQAPTTVDFSLQEVKPTHYVPIDEQALVFFDGNKEASADAGFAIISDQSISQGSVIAEHHFETYMHGTGQIRGEFVIATIRDSNSGSVLPETLGLYEIHGDHFHLEQTFADLCPDLHGSFQTEEFIAFACSDGIVKIKQDGQIFTSSKIANPDSMPEGVRIGKFIGSKENNTIVGLSRGGIFTVNLATDEVLPYQWQAEGVTSYLAYGVGADQAHLYVLDDAGYINEYSQQSNWALETRFKVLETIEEDTKAQFVMNKANNEVYLSYGNQLSHINLEQQTVEMLLELPAAIAKATWVGAFSEHEHDH